jgi:hypothetical protein
MDFQRYVERTHSSSSCRVVFLHSDGGRVCRMQHERGSFPHVFDFVVTASECAVRQCKDILHVCELSAVYYQQRNDSGFEVFQFSRATIYIRLSSTPFVSLSATSAYANDLINTVVYSTLQTLNNLQITVQDVECSEPYAQTPMTYSST